MAMTWQDFEDLYIDAMGGDSDALMAYRNEARKLAKRVNQQFRELEKFDIRGESYLSAQDYLGYDRTRFRERQQNRDISDIRDDVREMISFTNAKDYSVSEVRTINEQVDRLREQFENTPIDLDDEFIAIQINELFRSDAWKEMRKFFGASTDVVFNAQDSFAQGKTVDDLEAAYNDYVSDRDSTDIITTWNKFIGKW